MRPRQSKALEQLACGSAVPQCGTDAVPKSGLSPEEVRLAAQGCLDDVEASRRQLLLEDGDRREERVVGYGRDRDQDIDDLGGCLEGGPCGSSQTLEVADAGEAVL